MSTEARPARPRRPHLGQPVRPAQPPRPLPPARDRRSAGPALHLGAPGLPPGHHRPAPARTAIAVSVLSPPTPLSPRQPSTLRRHARSTRPPGRRGKFPMKAARAHARSSRAPDLCVPRSHVVCVAQRAELSNLAGRVPRSHVVCVARRTELSNLAGPGRLGNHSAWVAAVLKRVPDGQPSTAIQAPCDETCRSTSR